MKSVPIKELCISCYFVRVFGRNGSSRALVSILMVRRFKHWLESARRLVKPNLPLVKSAWFGLECL